MENNKNKKSVKFQGDVLNFCDFIHVFVFTTNHHLKAASVPYEKRQMSALTFTVSRYFQGQKKKKSNNIYVIVLIRLI